MGEDSMSVEERAWAGFLRTHERLWRQMEEGLAGLNLSMAELDVLFALDVSGRVGVRMSDLAERRLMSTGGFTRLADRLERRGVIERRRSEADGRSLECFLTAEGRTLLRVARRTHGQDIQRLFIDRLSEDQLRALTEVWASLAP
ncbi:MarR family winged helix-turn-helix transcriptional regulator [Solicola sp. PLA-1-18]|uniref:MarR family winged helix-turn-helix transcriptional regulator n=1 Tax=Solicola sp. PLA-1-18 TaxID=3380532 RepID=UPI003B7B735C